MFAIGRPGVAVSGPAPGGWGCSRKQRQHDHGLTRHPRDARAVGRDRPIRGALQARGGESAFDGREGRGGGGVGDGEREVAHGGRAGGVDPEVPGARGERTAGERRGS